MKPLRWASATLTAMLVLAACSSNASTTSPTQAGSLISSAGTQSAMADPLNGTTWRSTFTCDDVSKALDRAGLQKYNAHVLRPDNLGHCDETMHTTLMFSDGELSITGITGETDRLPYQTVNDHTYVAGFVRDSYRVQRNRLIIFDTKIIAALYPYDQKELPGEQAFDVGWFMAVPFVRVS